MESSSGKHSENWAAPGSLFDLNGAWGSHKGILRAKTEAEQGVAQCTQVPEEGASAESAGCGELSEASE